MKNISEGKRSWNTPVREPWNPVIKQCLNAIDFHVSKHLETGETWHSDKANVLRKYVGELKDWIHYQEGKFEENSLNIDGQLPP